MESELRTAIKENNINLVKDLIKQGIDVNYGYVWNNTALHFASETGNFEIVKLLVDNGADVNATNDSNETALDMVGYVYECYDVNIANFLKEHTNLK